MERADLLYSGLMFAAGMLSLWTALLFTAAFVTLASSLRNSTHRCYNLIYKKSRSCASWCRRTYAPSFPI